MKTILSITALLGLILAGCAPSANAVQTAIAQTATAQPPTATPTSTPVPTPTIISIPEIFRIQLMKFLEDGTQIITLTAQGVNYVNMQDAVTKAKSSYNLAVSTWPDNFSKAPVIPFDKAFQGWDLLLGLWDMKINDLDNPVEPNINHYQQYLEYGGDRLILEGHPSNFIVEAYRDKSYIPFDKNIRILMTIASEYFEQGKTDVLKELK